MAMFLFWDRIYYLAANRHDVAELATVRGRVGGDRRRAPS